MGQLVGRGLCRRQPARSPDPNPVAQSRKGPRMDQPVATPTGTTHQVGQALRKDQPAARNPDPNPVAPSRTGPRMGQSLARKMGMGQPLARKMGMGQPVGLGSDSPGTTARPMPENC